MKGGILWGTLAKNYMQELLELDLSNESLNAEKQDLKEGLETALLEQQNSLGILLSYYYKEQGGLVENVRFSGINFETSAAGTVRVGFNVVYFNACWDIHETNQDSMLLNFTLDAPTKRLKLYGPSMPEREQNEI